MILRSLKNKYHWKYKNCNSKNKKKTKTNQYLRKEIQVLQQKTNINFEHCQLQPDDICGPCLCRDDEKLLKRYYCDCQKLQPKRDCLQYKQVGIKVNEYTKFI